MSVFVSPCTSLPPPTNSSTPLSPHSHKCSHEHSETDRKKEFRLPVSAPSVKLIRLRAPDNSIISDSLDNRKPLTTAKAPVAQYYQTLLYFLIHPADSRVDWHSASRAKRLWCLRYTVVKTECRDAMVMVLLLSCLAATLYLSQPFFVAILLNH